MTVQQDPFATPLILLRIAWMTRYQGAAGGDTPVGGGAYVAEHGFGHEIFNYQPFQGAMYGYGQPPGRKEKWADAKINLSRLGGSNDDASITGALAVWVATSPSGGAFVVGWYKNATIFRDWQAPPAGSSRHYGDADCGFYITARAEDAVLLTPDERTFGVPQQGKGEFGQSNIWYADDREQHRQFRLNLLNYIETRHTVPVPTRNSAAHQPDPFLRQKVERIAVETATHHFIDLGYTVDSVEKDNVGWDLNASLGKRSLKLEVKGLSGSQCVVELTPNEYKALKADQDNYRICVVTNTLVTPRLEVYAHCPDFNQWENGDGQILALQEIIAARFTAT